jgi:cytochrome c
MKHLFAAIACLAIGMLPFQAGAAADRGTPQEAEVMVKKAIAYYQKNGRQKSMDEFSRSPGPFVDRDLYISVLTLQGEALAHVNPKMRGNNTLEYRDADGKFPIKERMEIVQKDGKGWQEFKFFNPVSKKIEPKRVYFEKFDNLVFACGAYRPE